ncbi:MAG: hypothetical protein AAGD32_14720 [Planctomycetota bacterium]
MSDLQWAAGTFVLRLGEAFISVLPDLLVGVLVAVLLRHALGDERLQRWFGKAWVVAIAVLALPIGVAGVLPVAVMLRRAGVRLSSVVAVLLIGGAIGPLSLAYLMERATPALAGVLAAMLAATAAAVVLTGKRSVDATGTDKPGLLPALAEARPLLIASALPLAIGLIGFGAVAAMLPPSYLGEAMHEPSATHLIASITVPVIGVYPSEKAALFSGEAAAGHYVGAAWTMLLGGGLMLGSVVLALRVAGLRNGLSTVAVVAAALLIGFAALQATPRAVPLAAEDSHAFDRLSQPFHVLDHPDGPVAGSLGLWADTGGIGAVIAAVVLVMLLLVPWGKLGQPGSAHLSTRALRVLGTIGVVAWVGLTVWVYYPAPATVLEQMRNPEGELNAALNRGESEQARDALQRIDRLAHRGRIGALLRADTETADGLARVRTDTAELVAELEGSAADADDATGLFLAIRAVR